MMLDTATFTTPNPADPLAGTYRPSMPKPGDRKARILASDPEEGVAPELRAKLRAKANEFETMFASQMMAPMFETVEVDDTFGGGHGEEMFRSFLVNEYSKQITSRGSLGIANQVYTELLRAQETSHGR
jgi:peptidoglycan hydrolase FlgJ